MKRIIRRLILVCITATMLAAGAVQFQPGYAAEPPIPVFIDNWRVAFDVDPYVNKGITMVPIRAIAEGLGATVNYADRVVTFTLAGKAVRLTIGSMDALVGGQTVTMPTAAVIKSNRTYVPLRFVSENLGAIVDYEYGEVYIWTEPTRAQHSGNTMNGNTVAESETAVYWIDEGDVYEQDKQTGETVKLAYNIIADDTKKTDDGYTMTVKEPIMAESICVKGNTLYCGSNSQILAVDTGSGDTTLVSDLVFATQAGMWQITNIQIYGDCLYVAYCTPGRNFSGWRVSVKDGSAEELSESGRLIYTFCVYGGRVFMSTYNFMPEWDFPPSGAGFTIVKTTLSGKVIGSICFVPWEQWVSDLAVYGGMVYFYTSPSILRIGFDGSGYETLVTEKHILTYNVDGGYLYYSLGDGVNSPPLSGGIYKMDLETGERVQLADEPTEEITILSGRLYYRGAQGLVSIDP